MPLPSEHSCRLVQPGEFKRFARMERDHDGKKYSVIIGWYKDKEGSDDQAYRYNKEVWTEASARAHCQEKEGTFEPAKKDVEGGEASMREFKFAYPIKLEGVEYPASIEILKEGIWEHPEAPDGVLEVSKEDLEEFVKNFKAKVLGSELPLDYEHKPEKGHAIGWITKLWTKVTGGVCHLWAKLNVTDEEARKDLKSGCLKYISPQILIGWMNPEDKKNYDVIRSAALTNYPYIKNMEPAIVNFSEITNKEVKNTMDEKELKKLKEDIEKRELELTQKQAGLDKTYATKKAELDEMEATLKESQEKFEADKVELETAKTKVGKFDIMKAELDTLKTDFAGLKSVAETAQKVATVANEEAKRLTKEKKEIEADVKITELVKAGKVLPAQKDELKKVLLAEEGATIELTEGEGDAKITRKVDRVDRMLELMAAGPAKVDLTQRSEVLTAEVEASDLETFNKILKMTDADWAALKPEERDKILMKLNELQERDREKRK